MTQKLVQVALTLALSFSVILSGRYAIQAHESAVIALRILEKCSRSKRRESLRAAHLSVKKRAGLG